MRVDVTSRLGRKLQHRETLIGSSPIAARRRRGVRIRKRTVDVERSEVVFADADAALTIATRRTGMPAQSHQTIRLSRGRHAGPEQGACVMELASMLAGEPFTDHPECCCPVVGSFLRTYNDLVDDDRRQDLYRYAALIVGTRADRDVEQARLAMCREWAYGRRREWHRRGLRRLWPFGWGVAKTATPPVLAGRLAARLAEDAGDRHHREALAFVARLIAAGQPGLGSPEQAVALEPTPVLPAAE